MRNHKKARVDHEDLSPEGGYRIKEYHPTMEEMKDFSAYIRRIHADNGHRAGLAKIIPPKEYVPRKSGYADDRLYNMDITSPIKQEVSGEKGLYQQLNLVEKKKISVRNFKKLAEEKYTTPEYENFEDLERTFWKNIFTQPSIYGADVSGSLYDDDVQEFNLTKLNTILDNIGDDYGVTIQGVNTAYLYFGMWKTSFCWHTEDMDLYSINYLHEGAPKAWYCISPEHGKRFERLAASFFPHSFRTCRAFLRHKTTLISPQVLKKYSIPYSKCLQHKGQFMITFPYSYHSGFNVGFNIAEATNFALEYWIDFGKWATRCECSSESVKISMQTFVKRYQADRYEKWLQGKDVCSDPRDPKHVGAAPKPTEYDLYLMGTQARDHDEEENQKDNALQLIQAHDVKIKTKAARKSYPNVHCTYQLAFGCHQQPVDQSNWDTSLRVTHYSPYSTNISSNQEFLQSGLTPLPPNGANESCNLIDNSISDKQIALYNMKQNTLELKKRQKDEKVRIRKEKRQKEAIVAANQLLQFLPLTFTHEKRFNRCIAALPPHCSVCQLLEIHPKNNENIWGNQNQTLSPQTSANHVDTSTACDTINTTDQQMLPLSSSMTPTPTVAGPQVEQFKLPEFSAVSLPRGLFNPNSDLPQVGETSTVTKPSNPAIKKLIAAPEITLTPSAETDSQSTIDPVTQTSDSSKTSLETETTKTSNPTPEPQAEDPPVEINENLEFLDIDLDSSPLIQCSVCMLCVHLTCYGMRQMPQDKANWICDRCVQKNRSLINCELCPCRGGAVKEYNGIWFHVTCALFIPDVKFIDLIKNDSYSPKYKQILSEVPGADKISCVYCTSILSRYVQGRLVPCSGYWDGKGNIHPCSNTFHPTCGHRNGASFDYIDFINSAEMSIPIRATCGSCLIKSQRKSSMTEKNEFNSDPLEEGTQVIALASSNGYYYDAIIRTRQMATYYDVYFPEQNETEVFVREHKILNFNPLRKFQVGDEVKLKGHKNKEARTGKFKNQHTVEEYMVQFDGISQEGLERVQRKNIYLNSDVIPPEVMRKFRGKFKAFIDDKQNSGEFCVIAAEEVTSDRPPMIL